MRINLRTKCCNNNICYLSISIYPPLNEILSLSPKITLDIIIIIIITTIILVQSIET
jgi:hypothetical protein